VDIQDGGGAMEGSEPIFTVRVNNFVDGTSAIGFSMPHSIGDGKSFFSLMKALTTISHLSPTLSLALT